MARPVRGRDVRRAGVRRRGRARAAVAPLLRPHGRRRLAADHPDRAEPGLRRAAGRDGGRPAPPAARGLVDAARLVAGAPRDRPDHRPRRRRATSCLQPIGFVLIAGGDRARRPGPRRSSSRGASRAASARPRPSSSSAGPWSCSGAPRWSARSASPPTSAPRRCSCSTRCSATSAGSATTPRCTRPWWVRAVIGLAGACVVVAAATLLFRAPARHPHARRRRRGARSARCCATSATTTRSATSPPAATSRSCGTPATRRPRAPGVSYRVVGSVSLASGNPVGDPEHWPDAIERWREQARRNGWSLAVMGAGARRRRRRTPRPGLTLLRHRRRGDRRHGRVLAQRPRHEGRAPVGHPPPAPRLHRRGCSGTPRSTADDFAALSDGRRRSGAATAATSAASRWRSAGSATPSTATACWSQAHDADGRLRGFLSFVPWGRTGLSLDLMRRDPTADNGLVELMVASLAGQAADVRHRAGLAQLRDVPRGLRARRRDRRRAGRPALAAGPAAGQQELAAGVALPLQRQVPARSGSRASSASSTPPTCRASASPPAAPRAS